MPTIFSQDDHIEPAHESHVLLYAKLFFAILLPTLVFLLFWLASIELPMLSGTGETYGLLLLFGITNIIQLILTGIIVLQWKNHVYFFSPQNITERRGILTTTEETYDMKNVRNLTIRQGISGKMFHYGDLTIHSSAPEFIEDVTLLGIPNPHVYEKYLKRFV